jgi:predicted metal-dependent phosphotriesterase family hydrolase
VPDEIMTVRGAVPVADLGRVLPHEHVIHQMARITANRQQQFIDLERMTYEVSRLASYAPCALVEVTNRGWGRDALALRQISDETGIAIIASTGWYRPRWYEPNVESASSLELTALLVNDLTVGIDGTDVRAGVIGELGTEGPEVSALEAKVLRVAAAAHRETGAPITLHAYGSRVGLQQVQILNEQGVDLGRIIVGHCDTCPDLSYHREIVQAGCWLQYDTIRSGDDAAWLMERRARWVADLVAAGFGGQILLSGDICEVPHLLTGGGQGYTALWDNFPAFLTAAGLTSGQVDTLFINNPQRALVGQPLAAASTFPAGV